MFEGSICKKLTQVQPEFEGTVCHKRNQVPPVFEGSVCNKRNQVPSVFEGSVCNKLTQVQPGRVKKEKRCRTLYNSPIWPRTGVAAGLVADIAF